MTNLSRQKSIKNIIAHSQNRSLQGLNQPKPLKLQELNTQPTQKIISISLQKLLEKHNPQQKQNFIYSQKILNMQTRYYDQSLIFLENQIQFNLKAQYLKRSYYQWEFNQKITTLGEYYKYHTDQPRIFLKEIHEIVSSYQNQRRDLEYNIVRDRIQQQQQVNENNQKINRVDSKNNIISNSNKTKCKKTEYLLKDIYLCCNNFQSKPKKQVKEKQINKKSSQPSSKEKTSFKSNSLNSKQVIPFDFDHREIKHIKKVNNNKVFGLKHFQQKQQKNLKTKYTQMISELFKKKRSSSKNTPMQHKIVNKLNYHEEKLQKSLKKDLITSNKCQNVVKEQKALETKKIVRSKSQANMNICKSSKLLQTFKGKVPEKAINLKVNHSSRENSKQKQVPLTNERSLKKQKFSSNKSLKSKNITQKTLKTVKVFEITKKDLIMDQGSKQSSAHKDQSYKLERKKLDEEKNKERKEGKQNNTNQLISIHEKKRVSSHKISSECISLAKKAKQNVQRTERQSSSEAMFGRVLKSKIRG